jgi:hypothetical protein
MIELQVLQDIRATLNTIEFFGGLMVGLMILNILLRRK